MCERGRNLRRKLGLITAFILCIILTGCAKEAVATRQTEAVTKEITDMAGRKVMVPSAINKIYATSAIGTILVYSLDPDKVIGQNNGQNNMSSPNNHKYTTEKFANLPLIGSLASADGNRANIEKILKLKPDIIITALVAEQDLVVAIESADRLQEKIRIPVVVVNGGLTQMDKSYEFMGELLGDIEHSKKLAQYCRDTLAEVKALVEKIPEEKRIRVYYAEGPLGLATDPAGSRHTEVLDFVGGINVAKVPLTKGAVGQETVSVEQIMQWNPDLIIAWNSQSGNESGGFSNVVTEDSRWQNIKAVKEHQVYDIPTQPFNWFDRPPSINRFIGLKWLANLLYPEYVSLNMKNETKKFYKLFYHVELSDQDVDKLLQYSVRKEKEIKEYER